MVLQSEMLEAWIQILARTFFLLSKSFIVHMYHQMKMNENLALVSCELTKMQVCKCNVHSDFQPQLTYGFGQMRKYTEMATNQSCSPDRGKI